jgi:prepilin-type N-terminal cleavage/methylation domain-containing protein
MTRSRLPPGSGTSGFTLVEVLVVLVLLGMAAALVGPTLVARPPDEESGTRRVVRGALELSARRGEAIRLRVDPGGTWRVEGTVVPSEGPLAAGRIEAYEGAAFTLVLSPLGTCGFDVRSLAAASTIALDPLTCQLGGPAEAEEP